MFFFPIFLSISSLRLAAAYPNFPQRQASDGGKGKMSLETKIDDGVPGVPCG